MLMETHLADPAGIGADASVHAGADGRVTIAIRGEMDLASAGALYRRARAAFDLTDGDVLVDLGEVTFCDAQGLSVLVRIANDAQRRGGRAVLCRVPPATARLLRLTGLDRRFPMVADAPTVPEPLG